MQLASLNATYRPGTGKSPNRRLRYAGRIPAICYGKKEDPIQLSLDPKELVKALDPTRRANTVIELSVSGEGYDGPGKITVMLRDWQRDVLRGQVTHADFVRVKMDEDVHATVPLVYVGRPKGVIRGGLLHITARTLEIACTPDKIPTHIDVNVDELDLGSALHVSDVILPPGVRALVDGGQTVVTITVPRVDKAAEAKEATPEVVDAKGADAKAGKGADAKGGKGADAKAGKGAEAKAAKK